MAKSRRTNADARLASSRAHAHHPGEVDHLPVQVANHRRFNVNGDVRRVGIHAATGSSRTATARGNTSSCDVQGGWSAW